MKILYFSRDYTPHDYRILESLSSTEHRVYYLRLENSSYVFEDRALPPEIEVVEWKKVRRQAHWWDGPGLALELKTLAGKIDPDLVQAGPLQRSAWLAALAGLRPLISMSWGYDLLVDAGRNALWQRATRFTLSRSDLMIGDCETIRALAQSYGMPGERIVIFPWGVDLDHFNPATITPPGAANAHPVAHKSFTLLSTRSWEPVYGVDTIAEAYIQAARNNPDLRLVMLGNGSQAAHLKQRFSNAGILSSPNGGPGKGETRLDFPGQVGFAALPDQYRSSDVYISASHSDGTSISLLEAMACGIPVIVSDIPGNGEWVVPGENGWLFRDGDPSALASAIDLAYQQRGQLAEMGKSARKLVEERADWKVNFQQMLQAYERVANAK